MADIKSKIRKLRDLIGEHFNENELETLCFDIGVDYEDISADSHNLSVQNLVSYCYRHNLVEELIAVCKKSRPRVEWGKLLADEDQEDPYLPQNQALVQTPKLGRLPVKLTEEEVEQFLGDYTEWRLVEREESTVLGGYIQEFYRVYEFPTYELAFSYMKEVSARAIERYGHHPRWQNAYNRLEVWLTTFNLGYKVSNKDLRLARFFERIWMEFDRELF